MNSTLSTDLKGRQCHRSRIMIWMAQIHNCCKAKNNASCHRSIRFLKFVLEAYPNWQLEYELSSPLAAGTLGHSTSEIWRIASDSDKQPDWISQLDSCAWITSKITNAQAYPTLRRMTLSASSTHAIAQRVWRK